MDKLGDIELFVKIVKNKGLAAAGKEMGLSPATTTARLARLESRYGVRLLNRTTRRISLTEEGKAFFKSCQRIIADISEAEERLITGRHFFAGKLRVTATIDLGKQEIAPLIAKFVKRHPMVSAHLLLVDHVVNLVQDEYDVAIRYGTLRDNRMVARRLADNYRVLVASKDYIARRGKPLTPNDLANHNCLAIIREDQALTHWYFNHDGIKSSIVVQPTLSSNDGSQIREWALDGLGVALKSYWDVKKDLENGRLITVLSDYQPNYSPDAQSSDAVLNAVYVSKEFMPERTRAFIDFLVEHFSGTEVRRVSHV